MDSVEGCTDPKICARVAAISNEASGMMADFEKAVSHLLPACPVAAKVSKKRKMRTYLDLEKISRLELAPRLVWNFSNTIPHELFKLSNDQREELLDFRPVNKFRGKSSYKENDRCGKRNSHGNGTSKGKKAYDKRFKGQVAAAIKKQCKE